MLLVHLVSSDAIGLSDAANQLIRNLPRCVIKETSKTHQNRAADSLSES
jgi:hypothetical protein